MASPTPDHNANVKLLTGRSVLIVDDQAFIRRLVARALADIPNLTIYDAEDGSSALSKLKVLDCDAVLMDINMTPMHGLEALKQMRLSPTAVRSMPVVMLTTVADSRAVKTAMALDASGFIVKPASVGIMVSRLARAIGKPPQPKSYEQYQSIVLPDLEAMLGDVETAQAPAPSPPSPGGRAARPGYRIQTVPLEDVQDGDRLVQAVLTAKGVELLPADTTLTTQLSNSLRDLKEFVPLLSVTVERSVDTSAS